MTNNNKKSSLTCLGGIPVSVATATKCAVEVLRSDRSPSKISPESSIVNILNIINQVYCTTLEYDYVNIFLLF